jgi:hypothetical protein
MSRARVGLLITEANRDFLRRCKKLTEQIKPSSEVEEEYVDDFAHSGWEIQRYRGIGAALFNNAIPEALENFLKQLLPREDFEDHLDRINAAKDLARRYFDDRKVKTYVSKLLSKLGLNETAIEAEAFRLCAAELEAVHRIMALKQARCDKDLLVLCEIREGSLGCLQPDALDDAVPQLTMVKPRS